MGMGVDQARQHQIPCGFETVCVWWDIQCLTHSTDAVRFDEDISTFKSRVRRGEYVSTMHEERHWIFSMPLRSCLAMRHLLPGVTAMSVCGKSGPPLLQYATKCAATGTLFDHPTSPLALFQARQRTCPYPSACVALPLDAISSGASCRYSLLIGRNYAPAPGMSYVASDRCTAPCWTRADDRHARSPICP